MLAAYREHGTAALAHGNRGRRPHNATLPAEPAAVVQLATERYDGANHIHLTELLSERDGMLYCRDYRPVDPDISRVSYSGGVAWIDDSNPLSDQARAR